MKHIDIDKTYVINKEISWREIEGQILFLLPEGNLLYALNDTGEFVWHEIGKKRSLEAIIKGFSKRFKVAPDRASSDVLKFIKVLLEKRIILDSRK